MKPGTLLKLEIDLTGWDANEKSFKIEKGSIVMFVERDNFGRETPYDLWCLWEERKIRFSFSRFSYVVSCFEEIVL